jgi:exosortase/archaeosortase family protein
LYTMKFIGAFCILYLGTQAIIGLSVRGGHYSGFVHDYMDYPTLLRSALLYGAKTALSIFGYDSNVHNEYFLTMAGGKSIRMVYSCLGIGLISFWTAFIFANKGGFKKKLSWICGGLLLIGLINITRVALLLLAINKNWPLPFHLNNHTLFNIAAYSAIFILIYFFDRSSKEHLRMPHARP